MNRVQSYVIKFGLLGALLGCREDQPIRPDWFAQGWGEVSVLKNGTQWSNTGATALLIKSIGNSCRGYIAISLFKFSSGGYLREGLHFQGVPTQLVGRYQLTDALSSQCGQGTVLANYGTSQDDGDVAKSSYSLDVNPANYLEITAYDSSSRRISGRFRASFIKQVAFQQNDDPSTIAFESGQFTTPVADKGRFE